MQQPSSIGPYQIIRELGRGGMGVVHLARDSRLDREVAIKGIPEAMQADADRLARFQREAKVLASLNHPNIGAIHGLEEVGGRQYLVLEYIEGETLAERLIQGSIPVDEALGLARQIAEALEAAHEKGVVHRDLKPGNVMVTPDGVAKVLDFGLARTAENPSSTANFSPSLADSPTITTPPARAKPVHSPTIPGVIMGSAGYMSPEQARGKPVDKRSDIFSFGCVLFEMLTGEMPFRGETAADAVGATLHKEVDLRRLPRGTPPTVRLLLSRCLAKSRSDRLHDIGDARLEIAQAISDPTGTALGLDRVEAGPRRIGAGTALGVMIAAVAVAGGTFPLWSSRVGLSPTAPTVPRQVVRFGIEPPPGYTLPPLVPNGSAIAISPAGDRFVFVVVAENKSFLCVRDVADSQSRVLPNTEGCGSPFFSPDGKWLGYLSNGRLMKMPAAGGPALSLCEVGNSLAFAWLDTGVIVWGAGPKGLWRVSADGGKPDNFAPSGVNAKVLEPGLKVLGLDVPVAVPGADYVLSSGWTAFTTEDYRLFAVSLKDGTIRTVLRSVTEPRLIAPDRLLFLRGTTAMTVGLDAAKGEIVGEPAVALEGVRTDSWMDTGYIGASQGGAFAWVPGGRFGAGRRLVRVDEAGKTTPITDSTDNFHRVPAVSPDGRRAVVTTLRSKVELWVLDLERGSMSLLPTGSEVYSPIWSNDGSSILHEQPAADGSDALVKRPWVGGDPKTLPGTTNGFWNPQQETPDGTALLIKSDIFEDVNKKPLIALYDYAQASITTIRGGVSSAWGGRVSPDGKWLAYASDESGKPEVYLGPLRAAGPNLQVSNNGGFLPQFSRDGKRLFFLDALDNLMAVSIDTSGPEPRVSAPTKLFSTDEGNLILGASCVLPDGGFLMIERAAWEKEPPAIQVILNWDDELARLNSAGASR
ncbi:MAG: serine/threonine-protein kinase [Planctomycetes bacterium]|nr:serine/threonine-protein kinase [Planctomycetota bacterium]